MTTTELLEHFRTQRAVADKLGVSKQVVSLWFKRERIPIWRQKEIERVTRGKLRA